MCVGLVNIPGIEDGAGKEKGTGVPLSLPGRNGMAPFRLPRVAA